MSALHGLSDGGTVTAARSTWTTARAARAGCRQWGLHGVGGVEHSCASRSTVADGLSCLASNPGVSGPCLYGTCYPQGPVFYCECAAGYAGMRCDDCAPGYHSVDLQCVPD